MPRIVARYPAAPRPPACQDSCSTQGRNLEVAGHQTENKALEILHDVREYVRTCAHGDALSIVSSACFRCAAASVSRLMSHLDQVVEDSQPLWILTLLHLHDDGSDT